MKKVRTRGGDGDAEPPSLAREGENAASALTMMRLVKPFGEPNNGAQSPGLAGVDEEGPVRKNPQPAPVFAPRWAPTVMVRARQMP